MTTISHRDALKVGVLGDCHIHPGKGLDWPAVVLDRLAGTDLIVTLGDIGESVGLERLATIAPVIGVRGRDDETDDRTDAALRVLQLGDERIGCIFDPIEHGLASVAHPFTPVPDWTARMRALFGETIQVLLHASTHRASIVRMDGILVVDPGSALLPADGATMSLALLAIEDGKAQAEIVSLG
jgi:putative phosphoesterase